MTILLILLLLSAQQAYAQADFNVFEASIADLQEALSGGQVTSVQLVNQYIEILDHVLQYLPSQDVYHLYV